MSRNGKFISVECSRCAALVKAEVVATYESKSLDRQQFTELPEARTSLLICPSCEEALVTRCTWQGEDAFGSVWSRDVRVWPNPAGELSSVAPTVVKVSLDEAVRCHRVAAYTASVVMAGRALEAVCLHYKLGRLSLHDGLRELLQRELIDQRLWQWGDQLRKHRNLAAHASEQTFSREDATDLLDFASAICEHLFVLTPKFKRFMDRTSLPFRQV